MDRCTRSSCEGKLLFKFRLVGNSEENNEIETLLNIQYLFLEVNKEQDFTKYMPTILYKIHQSDLLSK